MQSVAHDEHTTGVGLLTVFRPATRHTMARAQNSSPQREALHSPPEPKDFRPTGSIFAFRDRVKTSQCFTYALWETAYKTNRAAPPAPGPRRTIPDENPKTGPLQRKDLQSSIIFLPFKPAVCLTDLRIFAQATGLFQFLLRSPFSFGKVRFCFETRPHKGFSPQV